MMTPERAAMADGTAVVTVLGVVRLTGETHHAENAVGAERVRRSGGPAGRMDEPGT